MTASRFGAGELTGGSRGTHHIGASVGQSLFGLLELLELVELAGAVAGVLEELDESELDELDELDDAELSDDDVLLELDGVVLLELPRLSVL